MNKNRQFASIMIPFFLTVHCLAVVLIEKHTRHVFCSQVNLCRESVSLQLHTRTRTHALFPLHPPSYVSGPHFPIRSGVFVFAHIVTSDF